MKCDAPFYLLLATTILFGTSYAIGADQVQEDHSLFNDWGSSNGQTFIPAIDGMLYGIEIAIETNNNPGSIEVFLWRTDSAGKPIEPALTSGYFDKTNVVHPYPAWYPVFFDPPYIQTPGEKLAFTISLLTSGPSGWNEYGYVDTDTYPRGCRILYNPSWLPGTFSSYSNSDWAFRTLVIPDTPMSFTIQDAEPSYTFGSVSSEEYIQYALQVCTNLSTEAWSNISVQIGSGAPLTWPAVTGTNACGFFRLKMLTP